MHQPISSVHAPIILLGCAGDLTLSRHSPDVMHAQSVVQTGDPQNLSPAAVRRTVRKRSIAKDWATCVSLTDPEELARNKVAFAPISNATPLASSRLEFSARRGNWL